MKTLTINLIGACLVTAFAACDHPGRHTVIKTGDNNNTTKIEYVGSVTFNQDGTDILRISPNGLVKYKHNDTELIAESNGSGEIMYQINGGEKEKEPKPEERAFVVSAVKAMIKQGHNDY